LDRTHPGLISPEIIAGVVLLPRAMSLNHAQFFYSVSDLYVAPFRGEAFHLPALEAIACGVKAMVTEGGSADHFLTPGVCLPIKGTPAVPTGDAPPTKAVMIEPNYDGLVRQLRQACKQPGVGQPVSASDRQRFLEKWSWLKAADQWVKIIQTDPTNQ
jgi:glycosyltransferase involved in cell wall biosynthesis